MKKLLFALATAAAATLMGATAIGLHKGETASPVVGKVYALEAVTKDASPNVKVGYVSSVQTYTNATGQTLTPGKMYYFGLTNWNGTAYVYTNSFRRFDYADWTVLGTNHVVTAIAFTNLVVTNTYPVKVRGPVVCVTNYIFDASAANHYLMATNPALPYLSGRGRFVVTGADDDDAVTLIVK